MILQAVRLCIELEQPQRLRLILEELLARGPQPVPTPESKRAAMLEELVGRPSVSRAAPSNSWRLLPHSQARMETDTEPVADETAVTFGSENAIVL